MYVYSRFKLIGIYSGLVVYSFRPACLSWGFSTRVVLQGEGVSLTPNHRLVDQAFVFMSPGDRITSYTSGQWLFLYILVAS
jgi:hypothetical protein